MPTSFENFVNTELPKRISTNESPTTPQAGDIPVFTGVGLLTESKTASEAGLEDQANKVNNLNDSTSTAKYTSVKAVVDGLSGKQNTLTDVITADTYGSSTQYPVITFNAKGIATGVTLQTVPTPTFTDATFSVQKNGSPAIAATWSLSALTTSVVHTYPDKGINFGDLPSVATNDGNNLSGTRTRIVGGSNNTVSGTDNIVIAGSNCTINGIGNTVLGGELCNTNAKQGTRLLGRKAIAYTDFEQVDCIYYGTAHSTGTRQFYDRFAPNIRTYNTYMFGDITDLSVQNSGSLAFKPKAVIGLASPVEPAAAFHQIRIVALKMGGEAGAASMEVSLMCRYLNGVYTIVERLDSAVVGTAGIMGTFTFSIDASGYLIIQKSSQSSNWGYFIYGKAYHTATQ